MSTAYGYAAINRIPGPTQADKERMAAISFAWQAYRGRFRDVLTQDKGQPNFNVKPNRCGPIVDTGVDYLLKDNINLDVSSAGKDWQGKLEASWGSPRKMMTQFIKGAQSGAVGGHQAFRVLPPGTPDNMSKFTRFVLIDPQTLAVQTDPDDCEVVTAYIIEYTLRQDNGLSLTKRQVFQRTDENPQASENEDVLEHWTITNYESTAGESGLHPVGQPVEWAYEFEPIIHNQNLPNPHEFWGVPDLSDPIVWLNEAIILGKSNANKLGWLYSHPVYWSDILDAAMIDLSPGGVVGVGPGAMLAAIEAKANVPDLLAYVETLLEDMDEMSGVPGVATGRVKEAKFGQLSGVAIALMYMRLVAKTMTKRLLYGATYAKMAQIHLYFAGMGTKALTIQPIIHWPDILPTDDATFWAAVPMKQSIGISDDTIGTEAGYDMAQEREKMADQQEQANKDAIAGQGIAPQAQVFGKQPLPPEFTQQQQVVKQAAQNGNAPESEP